MGGLDTGVPSSDAQQLPFTDPVDAVEGLSTGASAWAVLDVRAICFEFLCFRIQPTRVDLRYGSAVSEAVPTSGPGIELKLGSATVMKERPLVKWQRVLISPASPRQCQSSQHGVCVR